MPIKKTWRATEKPKRRAVQHESQEQRALFEWAATQKGLENLFAIPNGGRRDGFTGKMMKLEGVRKGVPDIFFARMAERPGWRELGYEIPDYYHGFFIELKYGANKPSVEQRDWLLRLAREDYAVAVCYGWIEAKDAIIAYLRDEWINPNLKKMFEPKRVKKETK